MSFTDCAKLRPICANFIDGFGFFWMQLPKLKTYLQIYSTESQSSFTDKEFFSFGNGI